MDWDWIVEGDHVYDTRRERRSRLLRKRHMARVFRMLAAFTAVCLLLGVGVFAWIGVEQSGRVPQGRAKRGIGRQGGPFR